MSQHRPDRRAFLRASRRDAPPPIRPPWSSQDSILAACSRCCDCIVACPQGILRSGDGGFPEVDFRIGAGSCSFCGDCARSCAQPVYADTEAPPWALSVTIRAADCLAHGGIYCDSCRDPCDAAAIRFTPRLGGPPLPTIDDGRCTGCGACFDACPGSAISITPSPIRNPNPDPIQNGPTEIA